MGSITTPGGGAGQVAALAQNELDAQLMPQLAQLRAKRRHQPMRLHQSKVAEQHSEVSSECGSVPTRAGINVPTLGLPVCSERAPAEVRIIHHVVVQQGELV